MTKQELSKLFKWAPGHQMSVRDWQNLLRDSSNKDANSMFWAVKHGMETGRLPNWTKENGVQFFTNTSGQRLTSAQQRAVFVNALSNCTERTTAASLRALQDAFGLRTF